jgi:hypothetical protein
MTLYCILTLLSSFRITASKMVHYLRRVIDQETTAAFPKQPWNIPARLGKLRHHT